MEWTAAVLSVQYPLPVILITVHRVYGTASSLLDPGVGPGLKLGKTLQPQKLKLE